MPKKSLRTQMKILRGSRARFTMRLMKIPTLMTERDMNPSSMRVARISQAIITIFLSISLA